MLTDTERQRLALAEGMRENADRSEQELRDALSRSYYSVYHAARVWAGKEEGGLGHKRLIEEVKKKDSQVAKDLGELYRLRENADYDPQMVARDYNGDLERFRTMVSEKLDKARGVYNRILTEIKAAE